MNNIAISTKRETMMVKKIVPTAMPDTAVIDGPTVLGIAIRAKRTSLGLRLEDCAALCGIGINTLSRIENGNKNCTLDATFKVLKGLGLPLVIADHDNKLTDDP
jgi:predicted transcriptional regulator